MPTTDQKEWKSRLITPEKVVSRIKPGMSIFLGTGVAEPRTLIKNLMASDAGNLRDLEFIQLMSFGQAVSIAEKDSQKFRLKTFFPGWVASAAITAGSVDLVPTLFSRIPLLIESGTIGVDAAFVVDEDYQDNGIATFLLKMLVKVARERGMEGFKADVLATNKSMLKVFESAGDGPIQAVMDSGVYELTIPFSAKERPG